MLRNYLKIALRNLAKNKFFTIINLFGLAIGMAVTLMILNYICFEYSYDQMHEKKDQIYRVESKFYEGNTLTDDWPTASFGYAPAMKEHLTGIKDYVRIDITQTEQIVRYEDRKFREKAVVTTEPSFFDIFSFKLLEGDAKTALTGPNKVVISQLAAHKYFNQEDPIGKILTISTTYGSQKCEVSGILEDIPDNSHFKYDFFISWETLPNWKKTTWYLHETYSYVLLEPGVNPATIEDQFPELAEKYKTHDALKNKIWAISLNPLTDIRLTPQKQYERETKGNKKAIHALMWVAIAILLIAWINYVNLTTARSLERAREVGVRKVSGAFKKQLISQFLTESFILNMVALILAFVIFYALIPVFNNFTGKQVGFTLFSNSLFWMLTAFTFIIGFILSGFYPAFILSSIKPVTILKGKYIHSKGAGVIRKSLVVVQFAASLILICSTYTVYNQLQYMQQQQLGINIDRTLVVQFPGHTENVVEKIYSFKEQLKNKTGIKHVCMSNAVPGMEVAKFLSNHRANDPNKQNRLYEMLPIDHDFVETYGIDVIAGRSFEESYKNDIDKLVINEAAVKALGLPSNESAIGQKISVESQREPMEVIGVVKNYHQQGLNKQYTPIMMLMYNKIPWLGLKYISINYHGSNAANIVEQVKKTWDNYFPTSTFDYFFTDQYYQDQYLSDKRFGHLFAIFAALAVVIACIGLWVLALFASLSRTKEMGVRKVLGATTGNLFYNLSKEFISIILLAIGIGTPIAWYTMQQWLANYPFRTSLSLSYFVIPVVGIIMISLITISYQTLKTAHTNPANSLHYD
ncbi:FtsX-like permease family protein [Puteibacter caeruleilacunae]|nr:FtsX-like permease family protein [Puteibacter caeruleilacunae]